VSATLYARGLVPVLRWRPILDDHAGARFGCIYGRVGIPGPGAFKRYQIRDGADAVLYVTATFGTETEALVMGEECLIGVVPLEVMDLIVDPKLQRLVGRLPDGPCTRA
jgi:hypothetical protein